MYVLQKNTMFESKFKDLPAKLIKNLNFALFWNLQPKLADLICVIYAWRKNKMFETEIEKISSKLVMILCFHFYLNQYMRH